MDLQPTGAAPKGTEDGLPFDTDVTIVDGAEYQLTGTWFHAKSADEAANFVKALKGRHWVEVSSGHADLNDLGTGRVLGMTAEASRDGDPAGSWPLCWDRGCWFRTRRPAPAIRSTTPGPWIANR